MKSILEKSLESILNGNYKKKVIPLEVQLAQEVYNIIDDIRYSKLTAQAYREITSQAVETLITRYNIK